MKHKKENEARDEKCDPYQERSRQSKAQVQGPESRPAEANRRNSGCARPVPIGNDADPGGKRPTTEF